ncbi:unnamed protein product [Periconia digitata]|uniref:XRCC4 coiled-coil domain-containing protein n=1 Tax=Periconia digitata TaxID=1303443 RepID=A0A9W4UFA9_9PLEO|nr:unnamed protein product [Periconia digitata]
MQGSRYIVPVEPATASNRANNNDNNNTVVIEVLQEGSLPLDVRLIGCEGENPYVAHIKHNEIGDLVTKYKGSSQEWEHVLSHFLLHQDTPLAHDVHFVYTLLADSLKLSFQQHVEGIKVTLGEIVLPMDDSEELNPFEWAQVSAQHHRQTLEELAKLKSGASGEQNTIKKLQAQLDEFIATKNDTEKEMLQQFMQLLNEKKRKIRDQSRLLAGAQIDKAKAMTVTTARESSGTKTGKTVASRPSKRKATSRVEPEPEPEPEPSTNNDGMEVDGDQDSGREVTPDRLTDTETEDEGDLQTAQLEKKEAVTMAAKRELPFERRSARNTAGTRKVAHGPTVDGDETEDDEL